ncbi:MAG: hypothetical protein ACKODX_07200, partial [Gemmata sp.]
MQPHELDLSQLAGASLTANVVISLCALAANRLLLDHDSMGPSIAPAVEHAPACRAAGDSQGNATGVQVKPSERTIRGIRRRAPADGLKA